MNTKRYAIAGAASIIIHSVLLSAVPNKIVMAMPVGAESTRVSLNLVSAPQPTQQPPAEKNSVHKPVPVAKPKPIEQKTKAKKLVKKKKPEAVKEKPAKDVVKTAPKPPGKKPKFEQTKSIKHAPPIKEVTRAKSETVKKVSPVPTPKPEVKTQDAAGVNNSPKLVSRPTFTTRPSPVKYPKLAKRRGIEGQVMVEVWLDPKGKQVKHSLVKSSGAQVLDKAALEAIKRWHFSSHIVDGQAIAHRVQIPVRFQLD